MRTLLFAISTLVCMMGVLPREVHSQRINLEVYAGKYDSIPIAILPFMRLTAQPIVTNKPWEVIAGDLSASHRFIVTRAEKADSALFAQKGISLYVHGEYSTQGDNVILDCFIRDAASSDLLVGKKFQGEKKFIRSMAHRFSNQIYEMLFGEKGFFESRILCVVNENKSKNIAVMDYDGFNFKKLTNTSTVNIFPTFAGDSAIIWTSFSRGKPDLFKGNITTGKSSIFIYSRFIETSPSFSSITDRVAYASSRTGDLEIYTSDLDKTSRKRLTYNKAIDTSPCWSPNGYEIAFTSDRSGQPQIYIMDADGANTRRLTFKGKYQDSPAWSPRGDLIAYASYTKGKFDIWVIKPDGTDARKITDTIGNNTYPSWSPDGSMIVFCNTRGAASDLFSIRPDGTGLRQITAKKTIQMPEWSYN